MTEDQLIRRAQVYAKTGMTRYLVDLLEGAGEFPARVRVGQRAVFWSQAEVDAFVERTKQARGLGSDGLRRSPIEERGLGDQP
ncbi:helix-turn-helix transcriptional regulator [Brevundimonas sp.]|uniref:helix-turn-helix transcriptional regulator n=1 Tax=Brevundimonas sp. TaxID=1871086 RepID=UPI003565D88D